MSKFYDLLFVEPISELCLEVARGTKETEAKEKAEKEVEKERAKGKEKESMGEDKEQGKANGHLTAEWAPNSLICA